MNTSLKITKYDFSKSGFDWNSISFKTSLAKNYLSGNIILVKNFRPKGIDLSIFDELDPFEYAPAGSNNPVKKPNRECKSLHQAIINTYSEDFLHRVQRAMISLELYAFNNIMKPISEFLSEKEHEYSNCTTWRFCETVGENYHLDVYSGSTLRCFLNLSDKSRVWGVGHRSPDAVNLLNIEELKLLLAMLDNAKEKDFENSIGINYQQSEINSLLSKALMRNSALNHEICFDKYDLWIADGRKVAHEPKYGNKLAAFDFRPTSKILDARASDFYYPRWLYKELSNR